jgi:hypothetical protein
MIFGSPAEFDVERANARKRRAFGLAIDTRTGASLARAEAVSSTQRPPERTERIGPWGSAMTRSVTAT